MLSANALWASCFVSISIFDACYLACFISKTLFFERRYKFTYLNFNTYIHIFLKSMDLLMTTCCLYHNNNFLQMTNTFLWTVGIGLLLWIGGFWGGIKYLQLKSTTTLFTNKQVGIGLLLWTGGFRWGIKYLQLKSTTIFFTYKHQSEEDQSFLNKCGIMYLW